MQKDTRPTSRGGLADRFDRRRPLCSGRLRTRAWVSPSTTAWLVREDLEAGASRRVLPAWHGERALSRGMYRVEHVDRRALMRS
jgi:hypothetical protein